MVYSRQAKILHFLQKKLYNIDPTICSSPFPDALQDDQAQDEHSHFMHMSIPRIGIGMDSSITPLRHGGLSLVQTTDFFYPLVEDPYMQGTKVVL